MYVVFKVSEHASIHRTTNEQSGIVEMSKACRFSIGALVIMAIIGVFWHLGLPSWPCDVWWSTSIGESKERGVFLCSYEVSPREVILSGRCTLVIVGDPWIERHWRAGRFVNTTLIDYGEEHVKMFIEYSKRQCPEGPYPYRDPWFGPSLLLDEDEWYVDQGGSGAEGRNFYSIRSKWPVRRSRKLYVVVPFDESRQLDEDNADTVATFVLTAKEF